MYFKNICAILKKSNKSRTMKQMKFINDLNIEIKILYYWTQQSFSRKLKTSWIELKIINQEFPKSLIKNLKSLIEKL